MIYIEYDTVPTERNPEGERLWWLCAIVGGNEKYTSFQTKPTKRMIRRFKKIFS